MTPKLSQSLLDNIAQCVVLGTPPDASQKFTDDLHRCLTIIAESAWLEGYKAGHTDMKDFVCGELGKATERVNT